MWIEWDYELFNFDRVKRLYLEEICDRFALNIVFEIDHIYTIVFETIEEAEEVYENFKEKLVRVSIHICSIPE